MQGHPRAEETGTSQAGVPHWAGSSGDAPG